MARLGSSPTRARYLEEVIRADLLAGRLAGGQRLPTTELAQRFSVSTAVVREALTTLAAEGLLVAEPQAGFRVVDLSVERLLDLSTVRVEIECMALRASIAKGDLAWEASVVAAHHTLASTPLRDDPSGGLTQAWADAHRLFHRRMVEGCGSPVLLEIRDRLWEATQMFRALSVVTDGGVVRDDTGEHDAIFRAVLDRDADLAAERLAAHIRATVEVLLANLPEDGAQGQ